MNEWMSGGREGGGDADAETVTVMEARVRTVLEERALSLSPESAPVDLLRRRGRRRRRVREAMAGVGTLALVCGVALGVHAVSGTMGHAQTVVAVGGADGQPSANVKQSTDSTTSADGLQGTPPGWRPGPKLVVPTYSAVPHWMQKTDAASQLGADASKGHAVNQSDAPYQGCLGIGSSPLLWPSGYFAEGTPLTVFDTRGRAVYVFDKGFTATAGTPQLGWGDGELTSGYTLAGCSAGYQAVGSYALLIIFGGAAK